MTKKCIEGLGQKPNAAVGRPAALLLLPGRAESCIIRAMPTIDSDGCRPPIPEHADQLFRRMASSFSRAPESVVALVQNQWTACSGIWMDELIP